MGKSQKIFDWLFLHETSDISYEWTFEEFFLFPFKKRNTCYIHEFICQNICPRENSSLFLCIRGKKKYRKSLGKMLSLCLKITKKVSFPNQLQTYFAKKGGKFWCQISNETFWGNFSSLWFLHGSEFYWVGLGVFGESIFSRSSFSRDVQSDLALWRQLLCSVADQGPLRHSGRSAPTMGPRSLKVIGNWHEWPSLYSSLYTAAASEAATDALWQKQTQNCVLSRSAFETQKKFESTQKSQKRRISASKNDIKIMTKIKKKLLLLCNTTILSYLKNHHQILPHSKKWL